MKHLVVGLGSIGKRHAENLLRHGHFTVGFDPLPSLDFGFSLYDSWKEALRSDPEMVWICSPTHLHAQQAIDALQKGIHVFIEKPIAHSLEAASTIYETWKALTEKRLVWIGCNMRFHPGVINLKKALDQGLIGRPLVFRFHFSHYLPNMRPATDYRRTYAAQARMGGGIILDNIHDIDLALWLGGPVDRVVGSSARSGILEMDAEDTAHISLHHQNGIFSEIHMDFLRQDKSRGIEVIGDKGTLEWRSRGKTPERAQLKWIPAGETNARVLWNQELEKFEDMFSLQLQMVLEAVSLPDQYGKNMERALEVLKIAIEVKTWQ